MLKETELAILPQFYKRYVSLVTHLSIKEALIVSMERIEAIISAQSEDMGGYRYQPEKWSIKEVLCHMMDAERIFAYRALRFARNDKTSLSGFEENDYAPQANAHSRSLVQLTGEMNRLRATTGDLFDSFTDDMLQRKGTSNNVELSVSIIGYIIAGHTLHHGNVLTEKYLGK